MISLTGLATYSIAGIIVEDLIISAAVFLAVMAGLRVFEKVVVLRLRKLSQRTKTDVDDLIIEIIDGVGWPAYFLIALVSALQFVLAPPLVERALHYLTLIVMGYYGVKAMQRLIDYGAKKVVASRQEGEQVEDIAVVHLFSTVAKVILWAAALLLLLSNFGFNVSTLVAGLGVGGIAIAFALQNILVDIFASLSIYLDKPFQPGDFIVFGAEKGTVKHIGIKTTRLETPEGDELVVSNKNLTEALVHNHKKMERRRAVFSVGVVYETPLAKVKRIASILKEIVSSQPGTELARVHLKQLGDFSLNFEIVYHISGNDYNSYLDIQQTINLAILERFGKEKIKLAYPTQALLVRKA